MKLLDFFQSVNQKIEAGQLDALASMNPVKPTYFNWVEDIFYPMNVVTHGEEEALIWKYKDIVEYICNSRPQNYSFQINWLE